MPKATYKTGEGIMKTPKVRKYISLNL